MHFPSSERRTMELIIYAPKEEGFIKSIDWNFEDLKAEISEKAEVYMNLVYSDEQMKEAKKDRADLNRFKKALNAKRIEVKKQVMDPYMDFEEKIKELTGIVDRAVTNIDGQIKGYEKGLREEKLKKVKDIYSECIGDLQRMIPFEKVFKDSYLNAGTTLKSIREEMTAVYEKVDREMKLITADNSPYVQSMRQVYKDTLDFSLAMQKKQELEEAEQLRIKTEEERKKREAEQERFIKEQAALFEREKEQKQTEPSLQAPEMPQAPMLSPEGNVIPPTPQEPNAANLRRKRIVVSITANEQQFDFLNKALAELKANSEELKVLEKEEL